MIQINRYRLSLETLNVYINPRRPRTGRSIAQNITFSAPFFSFWCDSKPSLAFSQSELLVFRFRSPYRAAVPTCAQSSFLASLSSACSGVEHLSQKRESCDLHSYLLSYLETNQNSTSAFLSSLLFWISTLANSLARRLVLLC